MFSFTNVPNSRPKFQVILSECFDNYHLPEVWGLSLGYNNHMCDRDDVSYYGFIFIILGNSIYLASNH